MSSKPQSPVDGLARELEFRMAVTTAMLSTLELDEILYIILSGITSGDGLGFNRAFLLLDDEAGRQLTVRMAIGPDSSDAAQAIWSEIDRLKLDLAALFPRFEAFRSDPACQRLTRRLRHFSLPLHQLGAMATAPQTLALRSAAALPAVLARCLVNRAPFCSNALTLELELDEAPHLSLTHAAIVPLQSGKRLIGAIVADNNFSRDRVDSEKLRSLHAVGNLAALAIDRARLHQRTVAMAEVDGLTGVYNRRHYEREVKRTLEQDLPNRPLSIVVVDLDHFKRCNDRFGHLIGDQVLKQVAGLLSQAVRQADLVARYGGEEFVLLLRNTPTEAAARVAEKLRHRIAEARLAGGRLRLTASCGVASSTTRETPESVFARADQALYRAKQTGRNRVVCWQHTSQADDHEVQNFAPSHNVS